MAIAIAVKGLSYSYDDDSSKALDDVFLEFEKGKTTAILGHNGSGKSTLLRILCGMLIPTHGRIEVDGIEVTDDNVDSLLGRHIGMVFQNPEAQFVSATVRDDIAFGLENDRVDPKEMDSRIEKAAAAVGIKDLLDKDPQNLSGGQKQRVAIAGVLVRRPSILLLDESTSMLDPSSRQSFEKLLESIRYKDPELTVIEVTHSEKEALKADRCAVLKKGRLVFSGTPAQLFYDADKAESLGLEPTFEERLRSALSKNGVKVGNFTTPEALDRWLKR